MINKKTVFPTIIEAIPSFAPIWEDYKNEWSEENEDELPYYGCILELALYVIELYKNKKIEEVKSVFEVIEKIILNSDHETQEMMHVGFLEDLQNFSFRAKIKESEIEALLLPESKFWWNKVYDFWYKGTPIIDDRKQSV
jgi:hypothetical protein